MSNKWAVLQSLATIPLGQANGEAGLQSPFNGRPTGVIVKVKNWSASVPRTVLKTAISFKRGAERLSEKEKGGMSTEAIQVAAFVDDMSRYTTAVKPVRAIIKWDGKDYVIPPASPSDPENPPAISVPEGAWDLYCGNYERMNDPDINVRVQEVTILGIRRGGRPSPIVERDPDTGEITTGFLEFIREEVRPQSVAVDSSALTSGEIIEV
jgi:hypothetical protein